MIKNILRSGLVIVLAAGATSCVGGSGGQPLQGQAISTVMGNLNQVLQKLPRGAGTVTMPITGATTSAVGGVHAAAIDCETVSPTPTIDADADGIALEKISTFNCSSLVNGTTSYTRKGTYIVKDANDNDAGTFAGMSVQFNLDEMSSTNTTNNEKTSEVMKGLWKFLKEGSSLVSNANFEGHYKFNSSTFKFITDYGFKYTWDWRHTPTVVAAPWTTGSEQFEGTYEFDGLFHMEDAHGVHKQGTGKFVIRFFSKDITYDSTCAKWYKTGSLFVEDGNGSKFEVRYNCTTAEFYVNGKKSDIYTP